MLSHLVSLLLLFTGPFLWGAEPVPKEVQDQLRARCFVWNASACHPGQVEADKELVIRLTRKLSSEEAADHVLLDATKAFGLKDYVTSIYRFNQVLILSPKRADAYAGAAQALTALSMGGEALKLMNKAVELDPKRAELHLALAKMSLIIRTKAEVKRHYEDALALGAKRDTAFEKQIEESP